MHYICYKSNCCLKDTLVKMTPRIWIGIYLLNTIDGRYLLDDLEGVTGVTELSDDSLTNVSSLMEPRKMDRKGT